jgi:hypothetical protein
VVFDHCNSLCRPGGCEAHGWHTHPYPDKPEEHPGVGFVRIFLYLNGFGHEDGRLRLIAGSHKHQDPGRVPDRDSYASEEAWSKVRKMPRSRASFTFYSCLATAMHGRTCIFWVNLTAFSREGVPRAPRPRADRAAGNAGDRGGGRHLDGARGRAEDDRWHAVVRGVRLPQPRRHHSPREAKSFSCAPVHIISDYPYKMQGGGRGG